MNEQRQTESDTADVVVIGAGLPAVILRSRLESKGLDVVVVQGAGEGLTPHWRGAGPAFGPLAALDGIAGLSNELTDRRSRFEYLAATRRLHPYRRLGIDSPDELKDILENASESTELLRLQVTDASVTLPVEDGRKHCVDSGLEPVLAGTAADDSHDVVLDCPTAPFWAPGRIAALLENGDTSISDASVPADVFGLSDSRSLNSVRLAAGFEPERFVDFLSRLGAIEDADRLFAPPVLGLTFRGFLELQEAVDAHFDVELVEASPSRNSVQGERLRRYVGTSGMVEDIHRTDHEVEAIVLQDGSELHASTFVLSTGRWLGGLEIDYPFKERLFGLPAWFGDEPVDSSDNLRKRPNELLDKDVAASHPVNRIGIRADEQLRPLDRHGDVAFDNLHAVGDILGGTDPIRDGTRLGVQIVTALNASSLASQGG